MYADTVFNLHKDPARISQHYLDDERGNCGVQQLPKWQRAYSARAEFRSPDFWSNAHSTTAQSQSQGQHVWGGSCCVLNKEGLEFHDGLCGVDPHGWGQVDVQVGWAGYSLIHLLSYRRVWSSIPIKWEKMSTRHQGLDCGPGEAHDVPMASPEPKEMVGCLKSLGAEKDMGYQYLMQNCLTK